MYNKPGKRRERTNSTYIVFSESGKKKGSAIRTTPKGRKVEFPQKFFHYVLSRSHTVAKEGAGEKEKGKKKKRKKGRALSLNQSVAGQRRMQASKYQRRHSSSSKEKRDVPLGVRAPRIPLGNRAKRREEGRENISCDLPRGITTTFSLHDLKRRRGRGDLPLPRKRSALFMLLATEKR